MKLVCYRIPDTPLSIRPAPVARAWMDRTPERFANRCLPLSIANSCGWELLCPAAFTAIWDGGPGKDAIRVLAADGGDGAAVSHFGSGVLTFHVNAIFRTEPSVSLWVGGPINRPKDGLYPLTGIVETSWSPYTFTMNWVFTRPGHAVRFQRDEPFCALMPLDPSVVEAAEPEMRGLGEEPELAAQYDRWQESRTVFNAELEVEGSASRLEKWQKQYHRGLRPDGTKAGDAHRTKLRTKPFAGGRKNE